MDDAAAAAATAAAVGSGAFDAAAAAGAGAGAAATGPARGAHAALLQPGRGPPDHGHGHVRRGHARPGTVLQAGRRQLRAERRLRGQPRHTGTGQ